MFSNVLPGVAVLLLGLPALAQQRVVFFVGEDEYGSERTIPAFARELAEHTDLEVEVVHSVDRRLPDLDALGRADLLVLFLRFREASDAEFERFDSWFEAGGPAVALRTTSHALRDHDEWFPARFGGHYKGHADNEAGTFVTRAPHRAAHPLDRGIPASLELEYGGTYNTQPLADDAEVLYFGRTDGLPAEPVAWTFEEQPGTRRFYTSLGSEEDFEDRGFRELVANACLWALGREIGSGGAFDNAEHLLLEIPQDVPARREPPRIPAPEGATVLFDGADASAWRTWDPSAEPRGIDVDERAATIDAEPRSDAARWPIVDGALVAEPGFGDLVSREEFGDAHLHVEFWVPWEPRRSPEHRRGTSGVYVAGRWEIEIADSQGRELDEWSCGALAGEEPPLVDAAAGWGTWQTLDVTYEHPVREGARVRAWLNGQLVQDLEGLDEPTAHGFLEPLFRGGAGGERLVLSPAESEEIELGENAWTWYARFRTDASGTLISKCPPTGDWAPDAKALFLRGRRLVYDIGWVGALTSKDTFADGDWHTVVLTSDAGEVHLFVDGELQADDEDFQAEDSDEFVVKVGAANHDFAGVYEGAIAEVRIFDEALPFGEALALSEGEEVDVDPVMRWEPAEPELVPEDDDDVFGHRGPIRLQADAAPVRFANVWVAPLAEVDHASEIAGWDADALARGADVFRGTCVACHGSDGMRTHNPNARPFALAPLENGADPLSLYRTIGEGWRDMPANEFLTPQQRWDVVHYVRESFLREQNPTQYFQVDDAYLAALPKGRTIAPEPETELAPRDYGPALAAQIGGDVGAGLAVRLDRGLTIGYDLQTLDSIGAWTGPLLELGSTQHYQQRGEGIGRAPDERLAGLEGWRWGHGGTLDWDRGRRADRAPLPAEWMRYRGRYVHGDKLVLDYEVDGRRVHEQPGFARVGALPVVTHRVHIGPGEAGLVLGLLDEPAGGASARPILDRLENEPGHRNVRRARVLGDRGFCACAVFGGADLIALEDGRVALELPTSTRSTDLWILRASGTDASQLRGFDLLVEGLRESNLPPSPVEWLDGGPARWPEVLVTQGELGESEKGYAVDTLTLPGSNPWNAWLRTSALDFFPDGRAVVTTYGGDVWFVDGIDDGLEELRWKRFAAGLFEPMGVRVVDGLVHVTCRDGITRLHDSNGDDEADYYECFFADPDVSATFHAFNFDLQTDAAGNFYYAKSGQYTSFDQGGAIVRVPPDGGSYEYFAKGLRTPNGMGMTPGGLPLVSDNQGNWIPASKISLAREGGFYGVFPAVNVGGPGRQTRDDFDRPIVWMPQGFDSSSGGQLYVDDERFGPLAGRYLHTSFGKGWMYPFVFEDFGDVVQGAIWRLPFQFDAGIQRLRVNPADGQVYTVGLSGWQGPAGGADGCLQRVRWVGSDDPVLVGARATASGVTLRFDRPVAFDAAEVEAERWNYRWTRNYGSAHWSVADPDREGHDPIGARVERPAADDQAVRIALDDMVPCDQLRLEIRLSAGGNTVADEEILLTVNRLPDP